MCEKPPSVERSLSALSLSVLIIANNKYCNWTPLEFCHNEGDYLRQSNADFHPNVPAQWLKMQTIIPLAKSLDHISIHSACGSCVALSKSAL